MTSQFTDVQKGYLHHCILTFRLLMVVFTLAIGVMSVCATLKERTPPMNAAAVDVFLIYVDEPSSEILSERDAADEIMGSTPDV